MDRKIVPISRNHWIPGVVTASVFYVRIAILMVCILLTILVLVLEPRALNLLPVQGVVSQALGTI